MQWIDGNPFGRVVGCGILFSGRRDGPVAGVVVGLVAGVKHTVSGSLLDVAKLIVQQRQIIVSR